MRLKLKPCPRCFGTGIFEERVTINSAHNNRIEKTYYVRCPKCGAMTVDQPNKTWAMKSWNGGFVYKP